MAIWRLMGEMLAAVEIEALFWGCGICTPTLSRILDKNNLMVMGGAIAAFGASNPSLYIAYSLPHHTQHW
ncbi:MAG: hypothetical protein V7K90_30005 [Nostoc sp.]|uniref:hypothetical protein n=1 Tax=Nostoc sp. TaxID=1180 RepID=UPI002FF76811